MPKNVTVYGSWIYNGKHYSGTVEDMPDDAYESMSKKGAFDAPEAGEAEEALQRLQGVPIPGRTPPLEDGAPASADAVVSVVEAPETEATDRERQRAREATETTRRDRARAESERQEAKRAAASRVTPRRAKEPQQE